MDECLRGDKQLLFAEWDRSLVPVPPAPRVSAALADKVRGMLLGLAIGDSLGNTTEGQHPRQREARYGEIRHYLPNKYAAGRRVGLPSDDTQMAFWTLESLLRRGCLDPADLTERFLASHIYGAGSTIRGFLLIMQMGGILRQLTWCDAGQPSAGAGALMRIAPVLLPHLLRPTTDLWDDVVCATALTHKDDAAVAAGAGFVGVLAGLLAAEEAIAPVPAWWHETFLHYARPLESGRAYRPRSDQVPVVEGTLCDVVEALVPPAIAGCASTLDACNGWHSGAYLLETVPSALYILARHADDPEEALIRAVNDTRDSDTIGALVGAAVGGLHGADRLPRRWCLGLLGRTRADDDGHVQQLIEEAVEAYLGECA